MIHYDKIHKEYTSPNLLEKEQDCIDMLESYTDEEIRKQFPVTHRICLSWTKIRQLIAGVGMWREPIILKAWVELYAIGGWDLEQGEESYDYFLRKK